jgi:hypothetical protein
LATRDKGYDGQTAMDSQESLEKKKLGKEILGEMTTLESFCLYQKI